MKTLQATIFLESQRGCTQTQQHRSFHTFNFGSYANNHREPFGILKTLNDETLAEGASLTYTTGSSVQVVILPLVGTCVADSELVSARIDPGQIFQFLLPEGSSVHITNPYKTEQVNFLYLEFNAPKFTYPETKAFDIDSHLNQLIIVEDNNEYKLSIGNYLGRNEYEVSFEQEAKNIFACVIEGAFEVNNRLLHRRDGLALRNTEVFEFESLSNNAIILIIEFQKTSNEL